MSLPLRVHAQEWEAPQPSKRPDIFPEFEKMDRVFLPKPLPGDPEMPDEESEEAAKRTVRLNTTKLLLCHSSGNA